ncbi:ABC transporter ATP-binding protein [Guggenheimella bovis]
MIKKFMAYYKPHKRLFFLDLLAAFSVATIDLIYPGFSKDMINTYIPNGDIASILRVALIVLVLYLLRMGAQYFMLTYGHVMGGRIEYAMRRDLFEHYQTMDVSFFDHNKTGQLMSRLVSDLNEISELAHHGPEDVFISSVMLVGSFVILLRINASLTLIIFSLVVLMILYMLLTRKLMSRASHRVRAANAEMNAKIENSLSGVRLTKSFTNEAYEEDSFDEINSLHLSRRRDFFHAMGIFHAGTHLIVDIMSLLVLVLGGIYVQKGLINVGELVAYLLYSTFFIQPIRRFIDFTQQFTAGITGFERVQEILAIKPSIKDHPDAKELQNVQGKIEFRDVSFEYDNKNLVLDHFNLTIEPGKNIALVGSSGVGKTTVSKLITRFYDVTAGGIFVDGTNIQDVTIRSLRKNIGLVDQDVFIFYGTMKENILYGRLDATFEEVVEASKRAHIHEFIESLPEGYDTIVGERGVKLSGGQRQRVAIARVFLKNPPILLLDEATSALDNENERLVQEALQELSSGRTTLTIAHRLTTVMNADEILVLTEGGISERGTHDELMALRGQYFDLYEQHKAL